MYSFQFIWCVMDQIYQALRCLAVSLLFFFGVSKMSEIIFFLDVISNDDALEIHDCILNIFYSFNILFQYF